MHETRTKVLLENDPFVSFAVRYPRQTEPARRRRRSRLCAITRPHDLAEPLDADLAAPHPEEGPHDRADHPAEERVGLDHEPQELALAGPLRLPHRPHRSTTRAIAQRAGCAEGTLYRYFSDKHAVFMEVAKRGVPSFVDLAAALPDRAGTGTVEVNLEPHPDGYGPNGSETVEFLVATNPGIPASPLRDAASGGELSRIMLALTSLGAAGGAPVRRLDGVGRRDQLQCPGRRRSSRRADLPTKY